ncbi:MAG: PAS domain S-box protein [Desulfobacteraceae bacterium]|nr:PAS domain S-box protein [Desulfobacteraceae bacterium]
MSLSSQADESADTYRPSAKQIISHIWRVPFLRNIFLACLAVAILFPIYNLIYLSPAYRQMLFTLKEDSAKRVAAHITRFLLRDKGPENIDPADDIQLKQLVKKMQTDFKLDKLSLYDADGKVIFSTESIEVGMLSEQLYFTQKVSRRRVFSIFIARKSSLSPGRMPDHDVLKVFIPIIIKSGFKGAVEIYYDISDVHGRLKNLLARSNISLLLIAGVLMVITAVILFKAGLAMLNHEQSDKALRKVRDSLERRINERTRDLIDANKELQLEILERRQAVEAMRLSEKRFRTLVETIPHGIVEIEPDSTITFANQAYFKMHGIENGELMGKSLFNSAVSDEERQQLHEHLSRLIEQKPYPQPWFSKDITSDGRIIETQVDWSYKRDARGQVLGLIAVITDITQRRLAEKALLDNLNFMNTLIDTIPNPVFYKDEQGFFLGCNVAYAKTLGKPKGQIMGRRLIDLKEGAMSDMAMHYHNQDLILMRSSGIQTHEEQILCADGVTRDFMLFKATFADDEGSVAGLVGIMLDITDRKQVEKELKESKNLFDAFMQNLPGLAYMKDLMGRYMFVNDGFARFTGTRSGDSVGLCNDQVWNKETARLLQNNDDMVLHSHAAANTLETVQLHDGQARDLLTTRFPIFQDNALFALGGVSIDITERTKAEKQSRQLELQLQQAQKMEALGTLAGGIAHDFNNILASIIGYSEILASDTDKKHPNYHYLERVLESGERARSLVKQILTFSRQSEIEPKPVQVKIIVKEVLKLLRATLPATIEIRQETETNAAVMADPVQIHQVMMNLCTNAGYAMREKGGQLTVRLEKKLVAENFLELKPGIYLKLSITDTGAGISEENIARIYDPFFTTKPKGEGTGMGLSVVHGIVTSLGGGIMVKSTPGQGTHFDVYLPALDIEPKHPMVEKQALPVGKERIMFVDDELFQTDMLKHMLGLLGYKVQVYNKSPEALAAFEKDPKAFDLVITDMIMPEITGDQMAKRMLELRPDLPIILCTGFSDTMNEKQTKTIGIRAYALKPLAMEELAHLIRQVLDQSNESEQI